MLEDVERRLPEMARIRMTPRNGKGGEGSNGGRNSEFRIQELQEFRSSTFPTFRSGSLSMPVSSSPHPYKPG